MMLCSGTDMDGDGVGDWALCVDSLPPCKSHVMLMSIAASILQTRGFSQVKPGICILGSMSYFSIHSELTT